jgi:hypothetical protein
MNNLTRYETEDGIELVIDQQTGEAYATQAGYARMSGLSQQAINKRTQQTYNQDQLKFAELQTPQGLRTHNLIPAKTVFKWLIKDNPDLAEKMGECGATVYLHQMAGFKVASTPVQQPAPIPLPPADIRVSNLAIAIQTFNIDINNPRYKQGLQDLVLNILGVGQPTLTQSTEQWVGVAERAEELGYSPVLVVKHRSQLGKWVKANGLESRQEKRLCNGTQRPINLYLVSDELDDCIKEFLDAKVLASS